MSRTIPAVFDAGVFRPLEPVEMAEGTRVDVQVQTLALRASESSEELSAEEITTQKAAIAGFLARMEALPCEIPNDGFSSRDHDKLLYGAP